MIRARRVDVDCEHELVHADATHLTTAHAVDEHVHVVGEDAGEAVGIADGHGGDLHVALGDAPGEAVAHAIAHLGVDGARHAGTDAHDRLELDARRGGLGGLEAVEADAHAAHVKLALAMQDRAGRVVAVDEARLEAGVANRLDGLLEAVELEREVPVVDDVGGGEVREGARALDAAVEVNRTAHLEDVAPTDPDARHARVERQVVLGHLALGCRRLAEREREVHLVDGRHEVVLHERAHAADRRLREYENRRVEARLAKLDALGDRRHGELVGTSRPQRLGAGHGSVPVGIRLDDGHHLGAGSNLGPERLCIATQGGEVNLDPRPPVRRTVHPR